jgi:DNA-binding FadR family transcriptional regulator
MATSKARALPEPGADFLERLPGLRDGIEKRTVKDQIRDKLAYMICSGLLRIGDELPSERELASTLNVSRETVRSAIQMLAGLGMIEISAGSRSRVVRDEGYALHDTVIALRGLKNYKIETVAEARRVVEIAVVRDAASRMTHKTLKRLKGLLDAQRGMFDDPVRFQISDREFHQAIYETCANPLLADFVGDLYAYALDYRRKAMKQAGAVQRSYDDHCAIYAALAARDPDAAAATFGNHLEHVYKTTSQVMQKMGKK